MPKSPKKTQANKAVPRSRADGPEIARELSFNDLVALFNASTATVMRMVDGGYIVKKTNGLYQENTAVQGAIRYARDHGHGGKGATTKDGASARVNEARARAIEQETALKAKELVTFSEHSAILDLLIGGFSAELDGLPAQLTRDRGVRTEYEKKIADMKRRLSEKWARMAQSADDNAADDDSEDEEEA